MPESIRKKQTERTARTVATKSGPQSSKSPSQLIDARIKELGDWRGKMPRAIDFHEGEKIDEKALMALIRAAVSLNAFLAKG